MRHVTVLGAGLSGLAAAQRARQLGCTVEIHEREDTVGGHARSHRVNGFTFDEGPHVSFSKRPEVIALLADGVGGRYWDHEARVNNLWRGHWIQHPALGSLHGLPVDVVERCLLDLVDALRTPAEEPRNYAEWCVQGQGRGYSDAFTFPYTRKYWTVEASEMSVDWVGSRVYAPRLQDVVRGALAPTTANHHYITRFRYPTEGGFGAYVAAVADGPVHTGRELATVDLTLRSLEFTDGTRVGFESLISSLPLPELVRRIKDVPVAVRDAASRLQCTSVVLVSVGVRRDEGFPDAHWSYFYDDSVVFARGHLPHRLAPANAPPGCGSVQVEVYHSPRRPLPCKDVLGRAMDDLLRVGILRADDDVMVTDERRVPYANVLFDHDRSAALGAVQAWLGERGVTCCGRYGEWAYLWSDDSIVSGWRAAERVAAAQGTEIDDRRPGLALNRERTP